MLWIVRLGELRWIDAEGVRANVFDHHHVGASLLVAVDLSEHRSFLAQITGQQMGIVWIVIGKDRVDRERRGGAVVVDQRSGETDEGVAGPGTPRQCGVERVEMPVLVGERGRWNGEI